MFEHDATTFEIGQARLRLRDGLRFTLHQDAKRPWYLVEDDVTTQFYRIGLPEYTLLSVLDGRKSLAAAVAETSSLLGGQAFGERQAANLCKWVIESGLAETDASRASTRVADKQQKETRQQRLSWLNPISFKFPLFNPDSIVTKLNRTVGWLVSMPVGIVWIVFVAIGACLMLANWDLMVVNRIQSFGSADIFWMVAAWIGLKAVHETAHALVCKRFGGDVPQFGMLLLLMIPMPFVDVTSSWRFAGKYQRILTAAAGMIVELFFAAIAILVWNYADPGPIRYHAENIIFVATVGTILFNSNPLMRFDGYYILADWLEIPNLYQHGRQYVKGLAKWAFFGSAWPTLTEEGSRARIIKTYGFASTIWFFLITISLMLGACSLLEGVGLLLAIGGALIWFGIPTFRFAKSFFAFDDTETIDRKRFICVSSGVAAAILLLGWIIPSPTVFTAPIVIDYKTQADVRAQVPGFVKQICVQEGELVTTGQIIAVLDDPELKLDYESVQINHKEAELRALTRQNAGDIAAWQIEQESLEALKKRLTELSQMIESLTIRAPHKGTVLSLDLDSKIGTFVRPGETIVEIGNTDDKLAVAMVRQTDSVWLRDKELTCAQLSVYGIYRQSFDGTVENVRPRAQDHVPHPAFAANMGGSLTVVDRGQVDEANSVSSGQVKGSQMNGLRGTEGQLIGDTARSHANLKLTTPRVKVEIVIDENAMEQLSSGQTGIAFFRDRRQSLGAYLMSNSWQWLRRNITKTHGV